MTLRLFEKADEDSMSRESGKLPEPGLSQPDAISIRIDGEGRICEVDDRWCAVLGIAREDSIHRPLDSFLDEGDEGVGDLWQSRAHQDFCLRLKLPDADGRSRAFLASFEPLAEGNATWRAQLLEISDLVQEVHRERSEKQRLAAILDGAGFGTWEWNVQTGKTRFNERWAEIVGYRLQELAPVSIETWLALCHPDDLEASEQALQAHFVGDADWYDVEARMRHKDGRWIWVRDVGRVQTWTKAGEPEWMFGVHRDIDARKQKEIQLRRSEALLERAGMLAGLGCWEVDLQTGEIFWSDETCRIHGVEPGYSPSLEEGINFYAPEVRPIVEAAVEAGMNEGTPWDFELPLIQTSGRRVWVRAVGEVAFEDGKPVRLSGAFQDISARRENEQKLADAAESARRARDRLNTLADNAPGALFEHRLKVDGSIDLPYFSAKLPDLLGVSRAAIEADGAAAGVNIHPDDAGKLADAIGRSHATLAPLEFTYRLNHPERGLRWMQLSSIPFAQPDGSVVWHGNVFDVTEKTEAYTRLNTIAQIAPVGLFEYRRLSDGSSGFAYMSPRFRDLMGLDPGESDQIKDAFLDHIDSRDRAAVLAEIDRSRQSLDAVKMRFRLQHPCRGLIWLSAAAVPRPFDNGGIVWTGALHDVTAEVAREGELKTAHETAERMLAENRHLALHDGLTGLPNRRFFDKMLKERLDAPAPGRSGPDCALIQIDLDHFKHVNDALGHHAGDALLVHVADILRDSLRDDDFVARLGGDEFCVILAQGSTLQETKKIARRLQQRFQRPFHYRGEPCDISASFGILHSANVRELNEAPQILADAALYHAKERGRNRLEVYSDGLEQLSDRSGT